MQAGRAGRLTRRSLLGVAAGAGAAALAGCGASRSSDTLTVWGFPGTIEGIQAILPRFRRQFAGLRVRVQVFDYDTVHTNLLNAMVAETGAPDLAAIDCSYLAAYAPGLADLRAELGRAADDWVPPVVQLATYKDKFCGLVTDSEPVALAYRKDIWDRYDIHESDIQTWDDLADAGDHLYSQSHGKHYIYPLLENEISTYEVLAVEQGFGGYYFNDDDTKVIVDDPKIVDAVAVLKRLWDSKGTYHNPDGGYTGDEATSLLKKGTLTGQLCPGWYPEIIKQNMPEQAGRWRLMALPAVQTGGLRTGYQYPTILVVPKQSGLVKDAWTLERMGLTGAGARHLFENDHVLPAFKPLFNEYRQKPDKFFGGQRVFELWESIAARAPRIMYGDQLQEAQDIMGKHQSEVLSGGKSPATAMKAAASAMRLQLTKA